MKSDPEYYFYDSKLAVSPADLQDLYRFTRWGRSRSLEQIAKMLEGTSMCFSIRHNGKLIAFCRVLTDFVFRGSFWDILVDGYKRQEVADSGIGIGAADLPYIFERFYRTDVSRARTSGGIGIGLAIVKAIVEAHDGTITVASDPGEGSRFTVRIPRKDTE